MTREGRFRELHYWLGFLTGAAAASGGSIFSAFVLHHGHALPIDSVVTLGVASLIVPGTGFIVTLAWRASERGRA